MNISKLGSAPQLIIATLIFILGIMVGYQQSQSNGPLLASLFGSRSSSSQLPSFNLFNTKQPAEHKDVDFGTFWEVWDLLERDYLNTDKLDQEKMVNGAISGMTSSLGDPYTMYLPPVDNKRSGEDLAGAFYGVGIELGYVDGVLAVISPIKNTPADAAGLQPQDLILHVKDPSQNFDQDTHGWSLDEAVNHIRGEKGTNVILTILRQNSDKKEPFEVTLQRAEIIVPTVELSFVEHNGKRVAHMKLFKFGERTNGEWEKAVNQILAEKNNIDGIVLDMRNNPGGFFDGAIEVGSEFIKTGVVVTQKGKYSSEDYRANGKARLADFEVEVLVNKGSASASEIVAGALRDQRGAKLIGEKTFGKGTVQDRRELSNGGGIHITMARWLLPKGDWIHEEGIPVTIEVQNDPATEPDEVLIRAIEEI